jgi:hypothetical protein
VKRRSVGYTLHLAVPRTAVVVSVNDGSKIVQQRISHVYRRQRPTPLPSRAAKIRHQSQLGVDGFDVTHA